MSVNNGNDAHLQVITDNFTWAEMTLTRVITIDPNIAFVLSMNQTTELELLNIAPFLTRPFQGDKETVSGLENTNTPSSDVPNMIFWF